MLGIVLHCEEFLYQVVRNIESVFVKMVGVIHELVSDLK